MKNKGLIITIIILSICILGLTGYIVYDKVLNTNNENLKTNEQHGNQETVTIKSPTEFVNAIKKIEANLKKVTTYTIDYNGLSLTATKNEYNNIASIIVSYNGKQINKKFERELGYHTLNSYYFAKDNGLYIITLLSAPVAPEASTYIIAFDNNGNIKIDEVADYSIEVNEKDQTLLYEYKMGGGIVCAEPSLNQNDKYFETILYEYSQDEIKTKNMEALLVKDLPKCE